MDHPAPAGKERRDMLTTTGAFSGFSVRDTDEAREFWADRVGLDVREVGGGMLRLALPGSDATVLIYPKGEGHVPASFTVLNLEVDDVAAAIRELGAAGIHPLRYDGMPQDDDGAMRGNGPDIAWFEDPSGNVFSVIHD
jgi:catechol 2,3-dioxygenase-like lactoylglutathione lyase family enzyme